MQTVELGPVRLHVLQVHPGVPGEAERVAREVALLDPAAVLADLDTDSGLSALEAAQGGAFRPAFADQLFHEESRRRFGARVGPEPHPLVAAARAARNHRAAFVALRPSARAPHLLARWSARRAVRALRAEGPEAFTRAYAAQMLQRGLLDATQDAQRMMARLEAALDEGRAPLVAVVQAPRAHAFAEAVARLPRRSLA